MARPWIIFDADNTLWNVEALYDEARAALVAFIAALGHDASEVETFQQLTDQSLFAELGYAPTRFPLSFERTLQHFAPETAADELALVRKLAQRVFQRRAPLFTGVVEVLNDLSADFSLGLMTAGNETVQRRRIEQSGISHVFAAIRIVPQKSEREFRAFCTDNNALIHQSWSIGDSLRGDILPARKAGLHALWVRHHNWTLVEVKNHARDEGVPAIDDIRQAPEAIAAALEAAAH